MANLIKIKRGLKANLPALEIGELAFCTDTKELFIGRSDGNSGTENVLISNIDDFYTKSDFETIDGTGLVWDSGEEEFNIDFADGTEALDQNNLTKVMNPQRTREAINSVLSADLTSGALISESDVDTKITNLGGVGLTYNTQTDKLDVDEPFNPSGTFELLRAQGTTAEDVNLGNVTNENKATMFTNPTFTGVVTIADETGETPVTRKLTGLALPQDNSDAATKAYVDGLAQGIKSRTQALVLVDSNLAGTYDDQPALHELTADVNGAFPTTDGVDTSILNVVDARIVLAGQTSAEENGLYVVKEVGDANNPWVLRRCSQCDTSEKIPGSYVFITKGTDYENTGWIFDVDSPSTFVLGTDDINVIQFSGVGSFTAGNGLQLNINEFAINTTITMDLPSAQTVTGVKTFSETISGSIDGSAQSLIETNTGTEAINVWVGEQEDYDTLVSNEEIDQNTLYFIEE